MDNSPYLPYTSESPWYQSRANSHEGWGINNLHPIVLLRGAGEWMYVARKQYIHTLHTHTHIYIYIYIYIYTWVYVHVCPEYSHYHKWIAFIDGSVHGCVTIYIPRFYVKPLICVLAWYPRYHESLLMGYCSANILPKFRIILFKLLTHLQDWF